LWTSLTRELGVIPLTLVDFSAFAGARAGPYSMNVFFSEYLVTSANCMPSWTHPSQRNWRQGRVCRMEPEVFTGKRKKDFKRISFP